MKPYANLHLHSTHSDGVYSPAELVEVAKNEGYKALAITDHDTATAYPELKAACKAADMECVFGVEFTVKTPDSYHIVGFNFDPEYPEMKQYLHDMALRQTDNTKKCFELAKSKGDICDITWNEVLDFNPTVAWLCNDHVFKTMLHKGLVKQENYMDWFIKNFRAQRALFPPSIDFKSTEELLHLISNAGGFAVLAHPHNRLHHVPDLMKLGLKGIEVSHAILTEEERKEAYDIAIKNNLFISGGTDHSGLCGGCYSGYSSEEALKKSHHFIEPLSIGVSEEHFREIQSGKLNR